MIIKRGVLVYQWINNEQDPYTRVVPTPKTEIFIANISNIHNISTSRLLELLVNGDKFIVDDLVFFIREVKKNKDLGTVYFTDEPEVQIDIGVFNLFCNGKLNDNSPRSKIL